MKKNYHFARKRRQLKNRIKKLSIAIKNRDLAVIKTLALKIKTILQFSPSSFLKTVVTPSLITLLGYTSQAQSVLFNPPIDVDQSMNLYPLDFSILDTVTPGRLSGEYVAQMKFVDVDADGDEDVFYLTYNEACNYQCGSYTDAVKRIFFQENISSNNVQFGDPELIYSVNDYNILLANFPNIYTLPFEIADFDNDNDFDLIINSNVIDFSLDTIYRSTELLENTSNQRNIFNYNPPIALDIEVTTPLHLVDVDGDSDLDLLSYNNYEINIDVNGYEYWNFRAYPLITYLENNGTANLFPFDTNWVNFNLGIDSFFTTNDISLYNSSIDFGDLNNDGATDLFVSLLRAEDDSIYFDAQRQLYYFENNSSSSLDYDLNGVKILANDLLQTETSERISSYFNIVDIDADGDLDVNENFVSYYRSCGPCRSKWFTENILLHENIIEEVTSINASSNNLSVQIVPNPTTDLALIRFKNSLQENVIIEVFDYTGKIVFSQQSNAEQFTIKKNNLTNGIYFFKLTIGDKSSSGKIVFK